MNLELLKTSSKPREVGANLPDLETALDEFFEEGFVYQVNRREIEETPEQHKAAAIRDMLPQRTVPDGFFEWVSYLVWLEGVRDFAPHLQLTAIEVQGLALLQRCRNRFQRSHPPCLHCGMPNDEWDFSCHHCYKEIKH